MNSYNSYKGLSKKQTIIEILSREQRPLTPKEISWISKSDSRFKPLNHSTTKVYCRQLLNSEKITRPLYGYYEVTKNRYGVLDGVVPRVHDLRLVWCVDVRECVDRLDEVVGGVRVQCQVGSVRGKVSAVVGCDEGLDFHSVVFAVDRVRRFVFERAGVNLDMFECSVCCEFNEDYRNLRVDGLKCVSVKSFLGDLERIYNKPDRLRSEVKVEKTDLSTLYAMLKGGVSSYNLTQGLFMAVQEMQKLNANIERLLQKQE